MKKIKTGNRRYPNSLKRKVSVEYLEGKFSYAIGAELYGLKDKNVVKDFVKWYKKNGYIEQMEEEKPSGQVPEANLSADTQKILEAELAAAKLKIAGLEALIDQAEADLGISIRKKSGTKQSK